jgi:hypothetical protein
MWDKSTWTIPQLPTAYQMHKPVMESGFPQTNPLPTQEQADESHAVDPVNPVHPTQNLTLPKSSPTSMPHQANTHTAPTAHPAVEYQHPDEIVCYIDNFNHYRDCVAEAMTVQIQILPRLPSISDQLHYGHRQ